MVDQALTDGIRQHLPTEPNDRIFTYNSQELQITFLARIHTDHDAITLTSDTEFEIRVTLAPEMVYRYADPILEIRAAGWRCIL